MTDRFGRSLRWSALAIAVVLTTAGVEAQREGGRGGRAGGAPQGGRAGGLPPIPPVADGPFVIDTIEAQHRQVRVEVVTRGLTRPWGMVFLPDGTMLITERAGRVRVVRNGVLDPEPVAGAPESVFAQGLAGLLDIALHPQFAENQYVYMAYHKRLEENRRVAALARARWNGTALADTRDIFVTDSQSEASRVAFGPDGMLYMTLGGPGGGATEQAHAAAMRAQDPNDYAGKLVRLRDDGTVPPDNPFVGRAGHKPEIYTLGHRNQLGLAVNPYTGELWAGEQGPQGGDEVNIIRAGRNYGWPIVTFGRQYTGERVSGKTQAEGFEDPVVYWVPSIALSGLTFYDGDKFPGWRQSMFVGGQIEARTPGTGHVQRVRFNDRWEEIGREPLLRQLRQRIRDVRQGPDGYIYVLTDEDNAVLLRLEPVEAPPTSTQ